MSAVHAAGRCCGGRFGTQWHHTLRSGRRRRGGSCLAPLRPRRGPVGPFDAVAKTAGHFRRNRRLFSSHVTIRWVAPPTTVPPTQNIGFAASARRPPANARRRAFVPCGHVFHLALICSAHRCAMPSTLACWSQMSAQAARSAATAREKKRISAPSFGIPSRGTKRPASRARFITSWWVIVSSFSARKTRKKT